MNNLYTDKLKKILETYNRKQTEYEFNISNAKKTLLPAVADSKIKEISEKQKTTYAQAVESVNTLFDELKQKLSYADFPSTEMLTTDRLFFDGTADLDMSIPQVKTFIERYKNNHTMTKLIQKWILKTHPSNDEFDDWHILVKNIATPEKQLEEYRKIFKSCLGTINSINQHSVSDVVINDFCANENADFWNIIGDGHYLNDIKIGNLPIGSNHLFDDIKIA